MQIYRAIINRQSTTIDQQIRCKDLHLPQVSRENEAKTNGCFAEIFVNSVILSPFMICSKNLRFSPNFFEHGHIKNAHMSHCSFSHCFILSWYAKVDEFKIALLEINRTRICNPNRCNDCYRSKKWKLTKGTVISFAKRNEGLKTATSFLVC